MLTIVNKEGLEWIAKDFKSHVPCSQDGSCNGTQHFSAMLRDPVGAYSVNMTSATSKNVPCDIYGEVSQLAKENIKKDLALGEIQEGKERKALTNEEHYIMEVWLRKLKVDRKVAKRSTMIIPYGGQKTSCLNDIKEVLADRLDKMEKAGKGLGWDHNRRYRAAVIMHHYIWAALDVVVVASRKAMLFLSRIAGAQLSTGKAIRWTTPLGFPGYQEYKDMRPVTVRTKIFGSMIVKYSEATDETNQAKMRNAFAPNFVHSMDATHLMMTVNKAYEMGIENMALVHDSYAAPAGQCELFHKIIREQFVELYTPNRLLELLQEQRERNPRLADKFPTMDGLEPGDYDLNEVTNAPYFFR